MEHFLRTSASQKRTVGNSPPSEGRWNAPMKDAIEAYTIGWSLKKLCHRPAFPRQWLYGIP
jgi:hypothetical protein